MEDDTSHAHTATKTMRPNSPYIVKLNKRDRDKRSDKFAMMNKNNKIHRILLNSVADVEFVTLVSPSCIWVRLLNNVAGQLDYLKPYPINQALEYNESNEPIVESLKAYEYYMAPRSLEIADGYSDVVYSRARLLAKEIVKKHGKPSVKCYMHYIDHGYGAWMKGDCLGKMPKKLYSIPWQAIPVALMGASPCTDFGQSTEMWTTKQCEILRNILGEYKRFLAKPFIYRQSMPENYDRYARVELEAIVDLEEDVKPPPEGSMGEVGSDENAAMDDDELGPNSYIPKHKSVLNEYFLRCRLEGEPILISPSIDELTEQPLFRIKNEIPTTMHAKEMPGYLRHFPKGTDGFFWRRFFVGGRQGVESSDSGRQGADSLSAEDRPGLFISIPRSFGDCLRKAFSYDPLNIRRPVFRCQVSKTKNSSPFSCDPNICKSEEDEAEEKRIKEEQQRKEEADAQFGESDEEPEEKANELAADIQKWDSEHKGSEYLTPQIPSVLDGQNNSLDHRNGKPCIVVVLDRTSLNSPYDFYGHILPRAKISAQKCSKNMLECHEEMVKFYEDLDKWQSKLNDFYLKSSNCKSFDSDEIRQELNQGRKVYAIICTADNLDQPQFFRVKVVGYKNQHDVGGDINFCSVRLLDHGGTSIVNQDTLLRIHSEHAKQPPLSIQMCLSKIVPVEEITTDGFSLPTDPWTLKQKDLFRKAVITSGPMSCDLVEIWEEPSEDVYSSKPCHLASQTYFVQNLTPVSEAEEEASVEKIMVDKGQARNGDCPKG